MKMVYYAVAGSNGCAVFDSWSRVERAQKYFRNFASKKFSSFPEAEEWAIDEFCNWIYSETAVFCGDIPEHLTVNQIVFKKNILFKY